MKTTVILEKAIFSPIFPLHRYISAVVAVLALMVAQATWAFKPAYETYGHTEITRDILGDGYSFGGLNIPAFRVSPHNASQVLGPPNAQAVSNILLGTQSRDWDQLLEGVSNGAILLCRKDKDRIFVLPNKNGLPMIGLPVSADMRLCILVLRLLKIIPTLL